MLFFCLFHYITTICCLVKSVGSVSRSGKPMHWNTMNLLPLLRIWRVLCWFRVFLVGTGSSTLWWASSVVFTCRKPIWRSTSSSRSLTVALWYVIWKKTWWYVKTWCCVESWWNSQICFEVWEGAKFNVSVYPLPVSGQLDEAWSVYSTSLSSSTFLEAPLFIWMLVKMWSSHQCLIDISSWRLLLGVLKLTQ